MSDQQTEGARWMGLKEILIYIIFIELLILANLILIKVAWGIMDMAYPSPEVIYYMQNCNNLTLYPQGCQVQT